MESQLQALMLPAIIAFITFSLGIELKLDDFKQHLKNPLPLAVGGLNQLILLPLMAIIILLAVDLSPALSVGVMLLAFSPGGVTSNMLTRIAGGDVALSVSMTALFSLVFFLLSPFSISFALWWLQTDHFQSFDLSTLVLNILVISTLPVLAGIAFRYFLPEFATRIQRVTYLLSLLLFVLVIGGLLISNFELVVSQIGRLGLVLSSLCLSMMLIGYGSTKIFGFNRAISVSIVIETAIQNGLLAISIGGILALSIPTNTVGGFAEYALPAGVYGTLAYFLLLPYVFCQRRQT